MLANSFSHKNFDDRCFDGRQSGRCQLFGLDGWLEQYPNRALVTRVGLGALYCVHLSTDPCACTGSSSFNNSVLFFLVCNRNIDLRLYEKVGLALFLLFWRCFLCYNTRRHIINPISLVLDQLGCIIRRAHSTIDKCRQFLLLIADIFLCYQSCLPVWWWI